MTTGELSYREEKQVERILFYLTEYDGPMDDPKTGQEHGPLYRRVQQMAIQYQPFMARNLASREGMISRIRGLIVPAVVQAYTKAFPGELGIVTEKTRLAAAERIYDEIVTMEMEIAREPPFASRRMPGSVIDMPEKTIGHHIEARVNAAAKKAGFLGRR